ncbi:unnamed protein product, partial [Mesorhabditis spiculigera]
MKLALVTLAVLVCAVVAQYGNDAPVAQVVQPAYQPPQVSYADVPVFQLPPEHEFVSSTSTPPRPRPPPRDLTDTDTDTAVATDDSIALKHSLGNAVIPSKQLPCKMMYEGAYSYAGMMCMTPSSMGDAPPLQQQLECETAVSGYFEEEEEEPMSLERKADNLDVPQQASASPDYLGPHRAEFVRINAYCNTPEIDVVRLAPPFRQFSAFVRFMCRARTHTIQYLAPGDDSQARSPPNAPMDIQQVATPYRKARL